jgi:hypothetical protein
VTAGFFTHTVFLQSTGQLMTDTTTLVGQKPLEDRLWLLLCYYGQHVDTNKLMAQL